MCGLLINNIFQDRMNAHQKRKIEEFCLLYNPYPDYPKPLFVGNILWTNFRLNGIGNRHYK
jgi:hypothetical protein